MDGKFHIHGKPVNVGLGVKCCKKSKVRYAHFKKVKFATLTLLFFQHLTPSQTFITSKKLITTAKRKKLQKVGLAWRKQNIHKSLSGKRFNINTVLLCRSPAVSASLTAAC